MRITVAAESIRSYSLLFTLVLRTTFAIDVFCGSLSIFEQQRFGLNSVAISSQETTDMKQCLELCCSILNCGGVTFTGVIAPHVGEPNCLLVGCGDGRCEMNERAEYPDGLVSVQINRTQTSTGFTKAASVDEYNSTSTTNSSPSSSLMPSNSAIPMTSTQKTLMNIGTLAPVWAVGLAIVIAVACVGLNLGLLSAYICYRRQKSYKQTAHISASMGPRLHAYNPTI